MREYYVWSLQFVNDTVGCAFGNNGQILRTIDGGGSGTPIPTNIFDYSR